MECSAAPWSTMMGMDTGPVPTRHPTLFVGRRRVPEDGGPPCAVCHEDNVEGLIELCHFFVGVRLEVHRAGETGDVPVPGLVYHIERSE